MSEPMSNERLARLAADNEPVGDHLCGLTADEVAELVAEVKRARDEAEQLRAERVKAYDAYAERVRQLNAENERRYSERVELQGVLTVAAELIDRLTDDSMCDYDHHDNCRTHSLHKCPCPHPLGRQFVTAWRAVEAEQQSGGSDRG